MRDINGHATRVWKTAKVKFRAEVDGFSVGDYPTSLGAWIAIYRWLGLNPPALGTVLS